MRNELHPCLPSSGGIPAPRELEYLEVEAQPRSHPRDLWNLMLKRKRWVIGTTLWALLLAVMLIVGMTPVYMATTVLQITPHNPGPRVSGGEAGLFGRENRELGKFYETQYKILTSRGVAARVIEALGLENHLEFKAVAARNAGAPPEKIKSDMIDLFLDKLVVNPIKDTNLVEVSFKSHDRQLAKQVTETLAKEYMQLVIDSRSQSFVLVKDWLARQLQEVAEKMQIAQRKLYEFGQQHDFFALEDKDNTIIKKYIELSGLLTKAQSERLAKEALYRQIREKGPEAPAITNNQLIMTLRQQVAAQAAKVSGLDRTYLPGHPEMQVQQATLAELRQRLNEEVVRLQRAITADYEAALKAEKLLTQALEEQKEQLAKLQHNLVDFQILKRDAQTTEKLYKALLERMGETTVASTMVAGTVAVIDPPEVPHDPYLPRPLLFLTLGGLFGLGLGTGIAFLLEYLDDSIRAGEDVERQLKMPSLAVVPLSEERRIKLLEGDVSQNLRNLIRWAWKSNGQAEEGQDLGLVLLRQPWSPMAEAIRHLRTSLMPRVTEADLKAIVVTSPNPEEGKSTIAVNLAVALAQDGRQVALLDCDLRKPNLHRIFQVENGPGITDYLQGEVHWSEILRPTEVPHLTLLPAGPVPRNPAELLNSQSFRNLMETLRREFQTIVIDTPSTLGFADARVAALQADGVVLVVKHQATSRKAARLARQHFAQIHAQILGVVVNQVGARDLRNFAFYENYHYYQVQARLPGAEAAPGEPRPGAPLS